MRSTGFSHLSRAVYPYLYVLPAVIFFVVLLAYPYYFAIRLSFYNWNGLTSIAEMQWVGLENYAKMLTDPYVGLVLRNTLIFGVTVTLFQNLMAFLVAFSLFYLVPQRLTGILRTLYFYPVILSQVIVGLAWKDILRREGLLNAFLSFFTPEPVTVSWLGSPYLALWAIIWIAIWAWTGWTMVLYLGGLTGISREILEAAAMDGANTFQLVRHIILGIMRPAISLAILLNVIGNIQVFGLIWATTGGGPLHRTEVVGTYAYYLAFASTGPQNMGYAATFSTLMTTFLFIVAIIRVRATRLI